jgi:hypothetical protein
MVPLLVMALAVGLFEAIFFRGCLFSPQSIPMYTFIMKKEHSTRFY